MRATFPLVLLSLVLLSCATVSIAEEPCTCAEARLVNGWCTAHDVGYVAGLELRSADLHEALDAHGHELDPRELGCPTCLEAHPNGFCATHYRGFVNGLAYFSTLTYQLARGQVKEPSGMTCPVCKKNSVSHGWCSRCAVGMVGNVEIRDREDFSIAAAEYDKLRKANEAASRCGMCAVSMMYDAECPICKITYKDGNKSEAPPK